MNISTNWHSLSEDMLYGLFKTDRAKGLSRGECSKRIAVGGSNKIWYVKRASAATFAAQTLLDLATVLLLIFSVICAVFEKSGEVFAVAGVVALGGVLRVISYIWAQRVFEEKARGVIPRVRVIRSGTLSILSAEKLVTGDIVFLGAGDTVPADLRILSSSELLVFENGITENRAVVFKNADVINEDVASEVPIEKRENMLYAGSTVVSGEARCIVVATGKKTLAVTKYGSLLIPSGEKLKVSATLTRFCRVTSLVMIGLVALITVVGALAGKSSAVGLLLTTLALAAASMSEFFTVLGCIVIAISVRKADSEECGRAKIKDASSVETMNGVDTLVIESSEMLKAGDITLNSYFCNGRLVNVDEHIDGYSPVGLLKMCYLTTGTLPQGSLADGLRMSQRVSSSVDYEAIHRVFDDYFKHSWEPRNVENTVIVGHEPAGSADSGGLDTVLLYGADGYEAVVSGPLETVLFCCTAVRRDGGVFPITQKDTVKIAKEAEKLRLRGVRLVGVARRDSPYNNMKRVSALQMCMTFEGFIAVSDRVHGDALDVLRKCRESKVGIVCFTEGDSEDKAFLKLVGISGENDRFISLKEASDAEKICLEKGEFAVIETGLADSARKRREFLKKLALGGSVYSYISKEQSDMWAMKEAPISFGVPEPAMIKKTIPQSVRSSSHVVITPSGNGGGVFEAFRVLEFAKCSMMNLRRAADYLVASQTARLVFTVVTALSDFKLADPVHLLIWGLLLDFAVVILTAYRDPQPDVMKSGGSRRRLPCTVREFCLPVIIGLIWSAVLVASPIILAAVNPSVSGEVLENMIFVSGILSVPAVGCEFMTGQSLFAKAEKNSAAIPLSFAVSVALAILFSFSRGLASFFSCGVLSFYQFALALIPLAVSIAGFEVLKFTVGKSERQNG